MAEQRQESSPNTTENASNAHPAATPEPRPRGRAKRAGIQLVVAAVLAAGYVAIVNDEADAGRRYIWGDEFGWIAASDSTFRLMFLDDSVGPERWQQGFQRTTYGAMNPNFAKLLMGFALHCWGYDLEPPAFFPRLGPGHPRYEQLTPVQRKEMSKAHRPYIAKMRRLMLYLSAACAVALYFVGRAISGPLLGIGAYVAFVFTPLVKELSLLIYSDNLLLLMTLLSILATVRFTRWWAGPRSIGSVWRALGALLLIAGLYGATVGTKFNGALVCIACALSVVMAWAAGRFRHHRAWKTPLALVGVALVAFAVFVLLNPQLHDDVPGRIAWSVERWRELVAKQQERYRDMFAITTFEGQLTAVHENAVRGCGPLAHFLPIGATALIGVGFLVVCRRWIAGLRRRGELVGPSFLIVWAVVVVVTTTLWLPLNWPRYYLPLVPVFCLLQAVPVESAWRLCVKKRRARRIDNLAA